MSKNPSIGSKTAHDLFAGGTDLLDPLGDQGDVSAIAHTSIPTAAAGASAVSPATGTSVAGDGSEGLARGGAAFADEVAPSDDLETESASVDLLAAGFERDSAPASAWSSGEPQGVDSASVKSASSLGDSFQYDLPDAGGTSDIDSGAGVDAAMGIFAFDPGVPESSVEGQPSDDPSPQPLRYTCICPLCGVATGPGAESMGTGVFDPLSGDSQPWTFSTLTGTNTIDGVLWGTQWSDGSISYSDPDADADYQVGYGSGAEPDYLTGNSQLSALQLTAVHTALNQSLYTQLAASVNLSVEAFTGLSITYAGTGTGASTIRVMNTSSAVVSTARVADFPGGTMYSGDVWFGGSGDTPTIGSYDYHTVFHELGHALGLKHGHSTTNYWGSGALALPAATDSMEYSIMTYRSYAGGPTTGYTNESGGYAQTYMMYDIRALQELYGADFTANSGNTVYKWNPTSGNTLINGAIAIAPSGNIIFATIWDGNGIDTYDLSDYTTGVNVDLTPGGYSVFAATQLADLDQFSADPARVARGSIFNALQYNGDARSLIENAIGGTGNDTLQGNAADNTLTGNAGNDSLDGVTGDDSLSGGAGADTLVGSYGFDTLLGGDDNDLLLGGFATDSVNGGAGNDTLRVLSGEFYDSVDGGAGTDTLDHSASSYAGDTFDFETGLITGTHINGASATLINIEVYQDGSGGNTIISDGASHTYYGNGGNDTMVAEIGAETMDGGSGTDTIDLSRYTGNYVVNMTTGVTNFAFESYTNFENLISGAGDDSITGTSGANVISTGGGNDSINGGGGIDTINAGAGDDVITDAYSSPGNVFDGGAGTDTLIADITWSDLVLYDLAQGWMKYPGSTGTIYDTISNIENLTVGGGADVNGDGNANVITITDTGTSHVNVIDAGGGADTVSAGIGNDRVVDTDFVSFDVHDGGADTDWIDYTGVTFNPGLVTINLTTGLVTVAVVGGNTETITNFENVDGSQGSETIVGSSGANVLNGNGGNDSISGGGGVDTVSGGAGNDVITDTNSGVGDVFDGGVGTDTLIADFGWSPGVTYDLASGWMRFSGPAGTTYDTITGIENLTVGGAATVNGDGNANVITITDTGGLHANTISAGAGNDTVSAGLGNDTIAGGAGNDSLLGGADNDEINGESGADTVDGGDGNDTLWGASSGEVGDGADSILGGAGADLIGGSYGNDVIDGGDEGDSIYGDEGNDTIDGGAGNDYIQGDWGWGGDLSGADVIDGGSGDDTLSGGAGNDTVSGGLGVDSLVGGDGNDLLLGGFTTDSVNGGAGNDTLRVLSGEFYDSVDGGAGTDTLDHSASNYAGDTFDFETGLITGAHVNGASATLINIEVYQDGSGGNTIISDGGSHSYYGNGGDDYMIAEVGGETMDGGAGGTDTIDLSRWSFGYTVNMTTGTSNYGGELYTNFENLISGAGDDSITGTSGANVISTGGGNDSINGGGGIDTIDAGAGDDVITDAYSSPGNVFDGGAGTDTLIADITWSDLVLYDLAQGWMKYPGSTGTIYDTISNIENLTVGGGADVNGDANANVITITDTGSSHVNVIDAGGGADTVSAGIGNDRVVDTDFVNFDVHDGGADIDWIDYSGVTFADGQVTIDIAGGLASVLGGNTETITNFENVEGSQGGETIVGSSGANVLDGNGGNDTIDGGAGNDSISGGDGDDRLDGGDGTDTIVGGAGDDTLIQNFGGPNEVMDGGAGTDTGDWSYSASSWIFDLSAGTAKIGATTYAQLTSIENIVGAQGSDSISGDSGANVLDGQNGNDTIAGGAGNDSVLGGAGNDRLDGGSGTDTLVGGAGNDILIQGFGGPNEVMDGGAGTDTGDWSYSASDSWIIDLTAGTAKIGATTFAQLTSIENVVGGQLADTITGDDGNNVIDGQDGNDTVDGGAGNDSLVGDDGDDRLDGGDGTDTLVGGAGNDTLIQNLGGPNEVLDGGAGTDTGDWSYNVGDSWIIDLTAGTAKIGVTTFAQLTSIENVVGGQVADTITGDAGDNVLDGQGGNDTIDGGAGNDSLVGGAGNDRLDGGNGTDTLRGGAGNDTLIQNFGGPDEVMDGGTGTDTGDWSYSASSWTIDLVAGTANIGATTWAQLISIENVVGGLGNDSISGTGSSNVLDGGGGNDTVSGGAGNDSLLGGAGDDSLDGGAGVDTLTGGSGNDTMSGGDGSDTYVVEDAGDVVSETNAAASGGQDLVLSYAASYGLTANVENGRIMAAGAADLTGNGLANILYSGDGDNTLNGQGGTDTASYRYAGSAVTVDLSVAGAQNTVGSGFDTLISIENLTGSVFNDSLAGNSGANVLDGGNGYDTMAGGDGSDTYVVSSGLDVVIETNASAAGGTDLVISYSTGYALTANVEKIWIRATGAANASGNTLNNFMYAGDGNNVLTGGGGSDTVLYTYATGAVAADLSVVGAQNTGGSGLDTFVGIANLTGSGFNDSLTGSAGSNVLDGGVGADTMTGGNGSDTYVVDNAGDVVSETNAAAAGGVDLVQTSLAAYTLGANVENGRIMAAGAADLTGNGLGNVLFAGAGNNTLDGQAGTDTASYQYAGSAVTVDLSAAGAQNTVGSGLDTLVSIENVTGSSYNDVLTGNAGANVIDGGSGFDTMSGGDGNDTYVVSSGLDVVIETSATGGNDLVMSYASSHTLTANVEKVWIRATGVSNATGNGLDNLMYAGDGNNVINGAAGSDTVLYTYATAGVTVDLSAAGAQATGGSGLDTLSNIENLTGSAFGDVLGGNAGANVLTGAAGSDTLAGAGGADTFVLNSLIGSDTIVDFTSGLDKISVSRSAIPIGDGDAVVENAATIAGPGGFATNAELVVVTGNIGGAITTASAAAAIGSATAAYAAGQHVLFVVDNGVDSALYLFDALNADALVDAAELTLLAVLNGTASTTTTDYGWGP